MTLDALAHAYLTKAELRLGMTLYAFDHEGWSDVVREAQELVELCLKGMLRQIGVDPPRVHDVGPALLANQAKLPDSIDLAALARASRELRKDRELSFYGSEDLIPTEAYDRANAEEAIGYARLALEAARLVITGS